ncbi:MAG: protein translocase subunit SecF [Holosporales bacterium]|jgi:preprotein translocase SecF subunit|nr:protein translocase subunit SecF [Holosporales bacterium]
MGLQFIPHDIKIDFVGKRFITFALSVILVIGALSAFFLRGLNYGIDFVGGYVLEVRTSEKADLAEMRKELSDLNIGEVSLQEFGSAQDVLIRIPSAEGDAQERTASLTRVKEALGPSVDIRRTETIGPKVGKELIENATYAVVFSILAILAYIWVRFEWPFAICGVIALVHDCIVLLGFYSLCHFLEFNTNAVVSFLLTASYSIHDTVVVYDRIRENMKKFKTMTLPDLINLSMNETLSRTVLTTVTTLLALLALCFFGGEVISEFSFPLLVGFSFGAFSSVCLSAPLLLYVRTHIKEKDPAK